MKSFNSLASILLSCLIAANAAAATVTLDFDSADTATGNIALGQVLTEDGFRIAGSGSGWSGPAQFISIGSADARWTGSRGLVIPVVGAGIALRSEAGAIFDAVSIKLARGDTNGSPIPVRFTGVKADNSTVITQYQFTDSIIGQNHAFAFGAAFTGLVALRWDQGAEFHQFDDIVLRAAVPEPATGLLFASLLGMLVVARRRSSRSDI